MDVPFPVRRGDADGDVLDGTPESSHGMSFEVGEYNGKVIVQVILPYDVRFQVLAACNRQFRFAFGIHDVHRSDGGEAVVFSRLQVALGISALASVGGITFYDSAVHFLHQVFYQCGLKEVVSARFAGAELYRYFPLGFTP